MIDFKEPFYSYSARNAFKNPSDAATERTWVVYRLLASVKIVPPGVAALVGFFIDCHLPSVEYKGSMCGLYTAQQNPARCYAGVHTCYPGMGMVSVVAKTWHSHAHHEVTDILVKLLRKGGPSPSSVRYVAGLLKRCAGDPRGSTTMRSMFLSSLLGGYLHSQTVAGPAERRKLCALSTVQLADHVCSSQSTRQLHAMVSEFVCANTVHNQPLYKTITRNETEYCRLVIKRGDRVLCTQKHRFSERVSSAYSVFRIMAKALNVVSGIEATVVSVYGQDTADTIADCAFNTAFSLSTLHLSAFGCTPDEVAVVGRCFSCQTFTSLKMLRHRLKSLSDRTKHMLSLYIFYKQKLVGMRVSALHGAVAKVQRHSSIAVNGSESVPITMCVTCASVKVQVQGIVTPKTKMGVSVNPVNGGVVCNKCSGRKIVTIDAIGKCISVNVGGSAPTRVVVCAKCTVITCLYKTVGVMPLCFACARTTHAAVLSPAMCLCGADANRLHGWYPMYDGGLLVCMGVCDAHRDLRPDQAVNKHDMIQEIHLFDVQHRHGAESTR